MRVSPAGASFSSRIRARSARMARARLAAIFARVRAVRCQSPSSAAWPPRLLLLRRSAAQAKTRRTRRVPATRASASSRQRRLSAIASLGQLKSARSLDLPFRFPLAATRGTGPTRPSRYPTEHIDVDDDAPSEEPRRAQTQDKVSRLEADVVQPGRGRRLARSDARALAALEVRAADPHPGDGRAPPSTCEPGGRAGCCGAGVGDSSWTPRSSRWAFTASRMGGRPIFSPTMMSRHPRGGRSASQ